MNTVDYNLCEMRCDLACYLKEHKDDMSLEDAGQVADMIKDLAAAERYSAQSCYYKTVVKAMENENQNYRMGYIPEPEEDYPYMRNNRYGIQSNPYYPDHIYRNDETSRYSDHMKDYRTARKHYTETHSPEDKIRMDRHANETIDESIDTLKEIWDTSDPELRKRMKDSLMKMLNETA